MIGRYVKRCGCFQLRRLVLLRRTRAARFALKSRMPWEYLTMLLKNKSYGENVVVSEHVAMNKWDWTLKMPKRCCRRLILIIISTKRRRRIQITAKIHIVCLMKQIYNDHLLFKISVSEISRFSFTSYAEKKRNERVLSRIRFGISFVWYVPVNLGLFERSSWNKSEGKWSRSTVPSKSLSHKDNVFIVRGSDVRSKFPVNEFEFARKVSIFHGKHVKSSPPSNLLYETSTCNNKADISDNSMVPTNRLAWMEKNVSSLGSSSKLTPPSRSLSLKRRLVSVEGRAFQWSVPRSAEWVPQLPQKIDVTTPSSAHETRAHSQAAVSVVQLGSGFSISWMNSASWYSCGNAALGLPRRVEVAWESTVGRACMNGCDIQKKNTCAKFRMLCTVGHVHLTLR